MNNLVIYKDGKVQISNEFNDGYKRYLEQKLAFELQEKELKEQLLEIMETHGIKSVDNDVLHITYKAPSKRKTVDTKALKDAGIYDDFTKETDVKASVTITAK